MMLLLLSPSQAGLLILQQYGRKIRCKAAAVHIYGVVPRPMVTASSGGRVLAWSKDLLEEL